MLVPRDAQEAADSRARRSDGRLEGGLQVVDGDGADDRSFDRGECRGDVGLGLGGCIRVCGVLGGAAAQGCAQKEDGSGMVGLGETPCGIA